MIQEFNVLFWLFFLQVLTAGIIPSVILVTIGVKKRFKDQMTTEFILASNLIMLVFIPLGIFHSITGQLLLKEISLKVNFMSLLDNCLHNKSTIKLPSKSLSDPNHNFYRQILFVGILSTIEKTVHFQSVLLGLLTVIGQLPFFLWVLTDWLTQS